MKDTLLLIDANSLIHRAFHALPPFTAPDGTPTGALYGLSSIILKILKERRPRYVAAAFDRPEPTFREADYKEYKATRAPTADNLIPQLIESQNLLKILGFKTFEAPGFEADDIVATLADRFSKEENLQIVILSGDRDLFQAVRGDKIVVEAPQKGISNTVVYDESMVKEKFGVSPKELTDFKGLVGDKSDNIPGVLGVGPKTAAELIQKYGNLENLYREINDVGIPNKKLEEKLVLTKETAFLSRKLAVLRRDSPAKAELRDLELKALNKEGAKKYFENLGFQSLVERLDKNYNEY